MRFAFPLLFCCACAAGCGGHVAVDDSDAATDARGDSEFVPLDTRVDFDAPSSDILGPPTDVGPPPGCSLMADACFAQFAAEVATAASCMGHPDTCAESGGTDASGCGHRASSGGGQVCSWSDGATTTDGKSTGGAVNAKGATCYAYTLTTTSTGADVTVKFADGRTFVEHIMPGSGGASRQSVACPDGTTSRTFTTDEATTCNIVTTCCSSSTPPSCSG